MSDAQFIAEQACPFLGLPDDPASHYSFADLGHRCHARAKVVPIELTYQASYCLGARYEMCSRYKAATRNIALSAPVPGPGPSAGQAPAPRRSRNWLAVVALLTLGLAATALVVIAANGLASPSPTAPPSTQVMAVAETASASPVPSASATSNPTPTPSVAVTPTTPPTVPPTPTFAPTQRPAPTQEPVPSPLIHIVQRGETLSEIARLYGVTVGEIAEANGIEHRAMIYIGQELIIPTQ